MVDGLVGSVDSGGLSLCKLPPRRPPVSSLYPLSFGSDPSATGEFELQGFQVQGTDGCSLQIPPPPPLQIWSGFVRQDQDGLGGGLFLFH